jgi:hypothetical protein
MNEDRQKRLLSMMLEKNSIKANLSDIEMMSKYHDIP